MNIKAIMQKARNQHTKFKSKKKLGKITALNKSLNFKYAQSALLP